MNERVRRVADAVWFRTSARLAMLVASFLLPIVGYLVVQQLLDIKQALITLSASTADSRNAITALNGRIDSAIATLNGRIDVEVAHNSEQDRRLSDVEQALNSSFRPR